MIIKDLFYEKSSNSTDNSPHAALGTAIKESKC